MQKKLPFKSYTIVNNNAAFNLSCPDLYRFFVLSLTADKQTRKTDTTLEQLASFVGEKVTAYKSGKGKGNTSLTERLIASGEVELTRYRSLSLKENKEVNRITYTFKEADKNAYRRIKRDFVELDLPIKQKGYLLKLFALCKPHSYIIEITKSAIAKELNMNVKTVDTYNAELISKGLLKFINNGYMLIVDSFIIDVPQRISKENSERMALIERLIDSKNKSIPLRSQIIYSKAKKNGFAGISNFDRWLAWILSGLYNFKKPKREDVDIYL